MELPENHPRRESLEVRHKLVDGFKRGLVADSGLIAHGRGEAFDYLLGERTVEPAAEAEEAAVALLLLAKNPVISVNGNVSALVPESLVNLAEIIGILLEVNLFYHTPEREKLIAGELKRAGAERVYGLEKKHEIPNLSSERANVDDALWESDVVLVALEDGDRTEALKAAGKKVIAIDLNPLSRTAQKADITIVDNIVRALPNMIEIADELNKEHVSELESIVNSLDNEKNLAACEKIIRGSV